MSFKFELGITAESKVYGLKGTVVNRSESLYGCNRYYIQPRIDKDGKLVDGAWFDEEDIIHHKEENTFKKDEKNTGGPASKTR